MLNGLLNTNEATLGVMRRIGDLMKAGKAGSLAEYARNTRVEPITVVDRALLSYENTDQVMLSLNNLFAAYYLQAVAISMSVGNIEINRHLERFNPNRKPSDNLIDGAGTLLSIEAEKLIRFRGLGMEASGDSINQDKYVSSTANFDAKRNFDELADLSVGKLITVELTDGDKTVKVPVSVRLIATESTPNNIVNILSTTSDLKSFKERYEGLKSGRLSFWRDIVMAQDLIDGHRERLMKDTTGVYKQARSRASQNFWSSIFSMNPSVATASNIFVMSKATADQVEASNSMKLKDFKSREKIFSNMYVMLMAVVDTDWDRVTFYTRGIPETTSLSMSSLKSSNKGTGTSIADILSAYQLGKSPNL